MSNSLSPSLRAVARSVYRDLWRASATTFSGAVDSSFEQHCHIFILLDTEGDPPVLLGMVLFAECRFNPLTPL
jgi:hypothetical protein